MTRTLSPPASRSSFGLLASGAAPLGAGGLAVEATTLGAAPASCGTDGACGAVWEVAGPAFPPEAAVLGADVATFGPGEAGLPSGVTPLQALQTVPSATRATANTKRQEVMRRSLPELVPESDLADICPE